MSLSSVGKPSLENRSGSPCVACRLPLPIQPAPISEEGKYWHCKKCGTRHHGMLLSDPPPEIAQNVVPGKQKKTVKTQKTKLERKKAITVPPPSRESVVCDHETRISRLLDENIDVDDSLSVKVTGSPFLSEIKKHGGNTYDTLVEEKFVQQYDQASDQVELLVVALEESNDLDLRVTEKVTRASLIQASEDMDLFVKLGINPPDREYTGKHNYHVAMLACSIAANMGWDEKTICEVGLGCLLHDIGMSQVPQDLVRSSRLLSDVEFADIARHPIHTFDLLERHMHHIPPVSRLVAYQIHERCDGSGYPRNRKSSCIHEAARVAAVADVYVALVSPRPYRPPMMPHYAVRHLLFGVREGKFDSRAVRALLHSISAFPIGSYMELKDNRVGRVIRARDDQYARPLIEAWPHDKLEDPPEIIDLSENTQVEILRPLDSLA